MDNQARVWMKHESKVGEGGKSEGGLIEVWIQQRGDQLKGVKVDYLSTRPIYKDQIVWLHIIIIQLYIN